MRNKLVLGLLLLCFAPFSALAQAWSVQVDVPTEFTLKAKSEGVAQEIKGERIDGAMIAVATPYHIGFGIDGYDAEFPVGDDGQAQSRFSVLMANVFVDIPVPWIAFSLGAGWGEGSFDPDGGTSTQNGGATVVKSTLSKMNLSQFYAQIGFPLFWGIEVHAAYREFRGRLTSREYRTTGGTTTLETNNIDLVGQVTSLGFRYTF